MRYFFHLERGEERIPDEEGLELPSLDVACRHGVAAAVDIAAEDLKHGFDRVVPSIHITDRAGQELASVAIDASLRQRTFA